MAFFELKKPLAPQSEEEQPFDPQMYSAYVEKETDAMLRAIVSACHSNREKGMRSLKGYVRYSFTGYGDVSAPVLGVIGIEEGTPQDRVNAVDWYGAYERYKRSKSRYRSIEEYREVRLDKLWEAPFMEYNRGGGISKVSVTIS